MGDLLDGWLWHQREALGLWLPVAFGSGIAAWFVLPGATAWAGFLLLAAAVAALTWLAGAKERLAPRVILVAALAAMLGLGAVWFKSERVAAPVLGRAVVVMFDATVEHHELLAARGDVRLVLRPDAAAMLPPRIRVTMPIDAKGAREIVAGERLRLRARLVPPPRAALPGGYDFARRAWFDRLGAVGSSIGPVERLAPPRDAQAGIRARLSAHIQRQVEGGPGAIAAAFATGDRGGISAEDDEAMRRAGLAHLLSISGLHVTAMIGGVMWVALRLLALFPWLALRVPLVIAAAAVGALAGIGYTLLTGSEIPTIRSLLAALLVLAALVIGREPVSLRLVAAGALVVLVLWPEALIGPSFQLSFAAVTAIIALHSHPSVAGWLMRRDEHLLRRFGRGMVGLLLTGIVVEVALMPIALFHFHKAGLYGALANIVAIPLTTFVVMPAEALALLLDPLGLGAPAWWVVDTALGGMLEMAHAVAGAPGAVAALPVMPGGAFALIVGGGLWLCLWRGKVRWWGVMPALVGMGWALSIAAPDLLITGDGRHVASRLSDGRYALLRDGAGDFVRDQMAEAAGIDSASARMASIAEGPDARCSPDFCVWRVASGGRTWTVMAARTGYRIDWEPLVAACARADIVIADRWLPRGCTPRWIKADRKSLAQTGGLAVRFTPPAVTSVASGWRGMPWANPETITPPRPPRP